MKVYLTPEGAIKMFAHILAKYEERTLSDFADPKSLLLELTRYNHWTTWRPISAQLFGVWSNPNNCKYDESCINDKDFKVFRERLLYYLKNKLIEGMIDRPGKGRSIDLDDTALYEIQSKIGLENKIEFSYNNPDADFKCIWNKHYYFYKGFFRHEFKSNAEALLIIRPFNTVILEILDANGQTLCKLFGIIRKNSIYEDGIVKVFFSLPNIDNFSRCVTADFYFSEDGDPISYKINSLAVDYGFLFDVAVVNTNDINILRRRIKIFLLEKPRSQLLNTIANFPNVAEVREYPHPANFYRTYNSYGNLRLPTGESYSELISQALTYLSS